MPTGRTFTLGEQCPLTRLTEPKVVPAKQTEHVSTSKSVITKKLGHTSQKPLTTYQCKNQPYQEVPVSIPTSPENHVIVCANQQEPNHRLGSNFPNSPSSSVFKCRTVRFGNKHFGAIMGYGDYVIGDSVISRKLLLLLVTPKTDPLFTLVTTKPHMSWCTIKKPDLTFFRVFGALCYPTNDSEDLGKLQPTADIGIFVRYAPSKKGYRIYNKRTQRIMETIHVQFDELTKKMAPIQPSTGPAPTFLMPGQISLGLVPNLVPTTPYVPPTNKELEILFQPMFGEYLEPPRVKRPVSLASAVPILVNSAGTPSSTTIDQDAPSPSHSPSSSSLQYPCIHQGVAAESTLMKENLFAPDDKDSFINIFALEPTSEASSSRDVSSAESTYVTQTLHYLGK
ncbi:retrovirus-related pol polyprotein from transposon TNT 1-94 [Tanacetum coccineum]